MGEVYAATDVNLARAVAIKVLPDAVAVDADRLARFEREARTLASLNHPNIAAIYGLERSGTTTALVMELVEGATLADRILEGPIPIDEALAMAKQIAEALEAAHEQGVVHRDLKPANVKVRPDGRVKVLDFGLAKVIEPSSTTSGTISRSPTITTPAMTQSGVILGTAAYMSPEQARGKPVDKRADIWAFGCVLFEMLTGRRVFHNDEVSDTLAMVLTKDPDWSLLPADTPESIRRVLRRALVKDRATRLPDIGAARLEIDDARSEQPSLPMAVSSSSLSAEVRSRGWLVLAAGAIAVAALATLGTLIATRTRPVERPITRALLGVTPADRLMTGQGFERIGMGRPSRTAMAFTPDGRTLVFSAERDGRVQLFVRPLDQLEATPIPGTDGASTLFVSPDGKAVGFYADGALKRVALNGETPVEIAKVDLVFGACWGRDDRIVFATQTGGLWRVPVSGGKPESITALQPDEYSHRLPQLLPDGKTVLFTSTRSAFPLWDDTRIVAKSLVSGEQKVVVEGGADARYLPTGHLIFMRRGTLMAAPFDAKDVVVTGSHVGLIANVMQSAVIQPVQIDSGAGQFAVSDSGSLAYVTGGIFPQDRWSIGWVDRRGTFTPLNLPPGSYLAPRLSPDGKRVAYNTTNDDWDLWIYDVSRGLATRLPMEDEQSVPMWTPDSSRVVFTSRLTGGARLLIRNADGNGAPETLPISFTSEIPGTALAPFANAWTSDGSLVFWHQADLWLHTQKETPRRLITSALTAEFSPDGRWIAYTSGRGPFRNQIYVQPYPALDSREQVTGASTVAPVWRGNELFFIETAADAPVNVRVMAVTIKTTPTFEISAPRLLFEGPFRTDGPFRGYDVSMDGQRFLMVRAVERPPERITHMTFVQNWFEELRARVPAQ
jgi:eukaryotic-like serine/threonine-protein kinase